MSDLAEGFITFGEQDMLLSEKQFKLTETNALLFVIGFHFERKIIRL